MPKKNQNQINRSVAGACLAIMVGGAATHAHAADVDMAKQNQALQDRLTALETLAKKEGLMPSGSEPKFVSAVSDLTVSGYAQASYFYNTRRPADGQNSAYLFNTKDNSFSLNKFKLTVASKPVATDKWDAAFRASLLFGDDAPVLNSGGLNGVGTNSTANTSFNDLREAYVELNVPIGTGLNVKAGEMISLLNWESGDGGAANPNFSQGYQWWFTGNGPSAGVQLGYNFTDKIGLTVRVDNGLFQGPVDNNQGKAFSGSLNFKPTKDLWINLIGWYESTAAVGGTTTGVSSIGGYQVTEKLGTGYEVDYFNFSTPANASDLWSVGGWVWYDFTSKIDLALRADYVDSRDGLLGPAVRPVNGNNALPFSTDATENLGSVTLTLNYKPTTSIKIQPEVRYDYTSNSKGLGVDGHKDRIIVGAGVSYLF